MRKIQATLSLLKLLTKWGFKMAQSSVGNTFLATGIPGEFSRSENQDTEGCILNSTTESGNVVGRVVHFVDGNQYEVGVAADGNPAGILCNPKAGYRVGLGAQAFLPNDSEAEFAKRGYLYVTLAAAADKGDWVYYSDTTGALITAAPEAVPTAGHSRLPGGLVQMNNSVAGVAEIYFDMSGSTVLPVTP